MNLVTGDRFWIKTNPIINKYSYLDTDLDCDVVIVGGGVTGAICAYYFANAGINTALVDQNIIGYESTSASTSILQYEIDMDMVGLQGIYGLETARRAFQLCKEAVYEIYRITNLLHDPCDFFFNDCFYYTNNPNDKKMLQKEFQLRQEAGFNVELLEEGKTINMFSFPIKAGIYSRDAAAGIDPYRFTHALIKDTTQKGALCFENTKIIKFSPNRNFVELTTHNGFRIRARKMIVATGFAAKSMLNQKTALLTRTFTIVTQPLPDVPGWPNRCIIRDNSEAYTYLRSTKDSRIIIGGEDIDVGGNRSKVSNLEQSNPISSEKYQLLKQRLNGFFPDLNDIVIEYAFSGIFGDTKDSLPYIGEHPTWPNTYFCLGYGANGIIYAILGGQMLRDLYLGETVQDLALFSFDRKIKH